MNTMTNTITATVQPYLFFDGRCEEALDFYCKTLGAEVGCVSRFKDAPEGQMCGSASPEKVMHGTLRIGNTTLLVSDGMCGGKPTFAGFCLSLTAKDEAEAQQWFGAFANGGQIQMPLGKTFFSPAFG